MNSNDINFYENLAIKKSDDYDNIMKALDIAKRYILRNKKILVGGMAIDFALKSKKHPGIYDDDTMPDFDVISSTYWQDAYEIAVLLKKAGFEDISVINAMHPSTMKVRINFKEIADITYIPSNIIENIPTVWYSGFQMVHPHYQYIDQHRSMVYPYENPPRETILSRPEKDMCRYDLLYQYYPLRMLFIKNTNIELVMRTLPLDMLSNQCISGFAALNYWTHEAKKLGFQTNINLGSFDISLDINTKLQYRIPSNSHLTIYSDNISELYTTLKRVQSQDDKKTQDDTSDKFYNRFLDKLPRRCVIDNVFELFDNNQKIAAHLITDSVPTNIKNIYIANLQSIMMYLLVNYILIMKIKGGPRDYSFYIGYLLCRDLITWASNEYDFDKAGGTDKAEKNEKNTRLKRFFPTAEVYGKNNISDSEIVSKHNFDVKNKTIDASEKFKYSQPKHVYDRDLIYRKIPKKYMTFDVTDSAIFDFDGTLTTRFLNH